MTSTRHAGGRASKKARRSSLWGLLYGRRPRMTRDGWVYLHRAVTRRSDVARRASHLGDIASRPEDRRRARRVVAMRGYITKGDFDQTELLRGFIA